MVMRFENSKEDSNIKSLIFVDNKHWLQINLEKIHKKLQDPDLDEDTVSEEIEIDAETAGGEIHYKAKLETCLHLGLFIQKIYMVGNFIYTIHEDV
jgi:hypothetical protein